MLGLLAFLSTTVFFSPAINLLLLPIALYRLFLTNQGRDIGFLAGRHQCGLILLFLSVFLAVAAFAFVDPLVVNYEKSMLGSFPYVVLIFSALCVGMAFRKRDLLIVLLLIFIEIFVAIAEYLVGTHSFFSVEYRGQTQIGDTGLLYYNRVYGLSQNSSAYAFKVLVGFAILTAIKPEITRRTLIICGGILLVGFLTSFNRTAIIAAVIGFSFNYLRNWRALFFSCMVVGVVAFYYLSTIVENVTRGKGELDLSGRDYIFNEFLSVFLQSPYFGNAAQKVWLEIDESLYHAHNSYLEFLTSNGMFISILFFWATTF